jgi:hypothetical protein
MLPQDFFNKDIFPLQVAIPNWKDGDKVKVGRDA